MSIEIGSTVSEEIPEPAERFYTPGSSTEVSQPIAESLHTLKSPPSFHTPSSDTPGGFKTPEEFPFSPAERKRPSTGDSGERFFSPVQFLSSPADEVTPQDSGVYTCRAINLVGETLCRASLVVLSAKAFSGKTRGRELTAVSLGSTPVILQCLFNGKPSPTANWYKDGEPITDSRCIIQEKSAGHFNLLITNMSQSDAGEYKCIIQNSAGCTESTALLKVF
uniref:Ig-like domain-containing protein n=1 Tax=Kryptolebias marmoratus TaxID=37003 RepID=A0A3Q3B3P2_KRYMA